MLISDSSQWQLRATYFENFSEGLYVPNSVTANFDINCKSRGSKITKGKYNYKSSGIYNPTSYMIK